MEAIIDNKIAYIRQKTNNRCDIDFIAKIVSYNFYKTHTGIEKLINKMKNERYETINNCLINNDINITDVILSHLDIKNEDEYYYEYYTSKILEVYSKDYEYTDFYNSIHYSNYSVRTSSEQKLYDELTRMCNISLEFIMTQHKNMGFGYHLFYRSSYNLNNKKSMEFVRFVLKNKKNIIPSLSINDSAGEENKFVISFKQYQTLVFQPTVDGHLTPLCEIEMSKNNKVCVKSIINQEIFNRNIRNIATKISAI